MVETAIFLLATSKHYISEPALAERPTMHWTKWSWLAFLSAVAVVLVACVLFLP